jgi:hypothetical protein
MSVDAPAVGPDPGLPQPAGPGSLAGGRRISGAKIRPRGLQLPSIARTQSGITAGVPQIAADLRQCPGRQSRAKTRHRAGLIQNHAVYILKKATLVRSSEGKFPWKRHG